MSTTKATVTEAQQINSGHVHALYYLSMNGYEILKQIADYNKGHVAPQLRRVSQGIGSAIFHYKDSIVGVNSAGEIDVYCWDSLTVEERSDEFRELVRGLEARELVRGLESK